MMLNKLANELCNPVLIFILFLVSAKINYFLGKQFRALLVFALGLVWLLLVISAPLSKCLVNNLESQYAPFDPTKHSFNKSVYVLVLSGGSAYKSALPPEIELPGQASSRLVEGIAIHRQIQGSTLMASGNSYSLLLPFTKGQLINPLALGLGEESAGMGAQEQENTEAEIEAYQKQIGNSGQLILVTSAMHMPRAMLICKKKHILALAAPTDYYVAKERNQVNDNFETPPQKMEMMQRALHEYLGLLQVYFFS